MNDEHAKLAKSANTNERKVGFIRTLVSESSWAPSTVWELESLWRMSPTEIASLYTEAINSISDNYNGVDDDTKRAVLASQLQHIASIALNRRKAFLNKDGDLEIVADPDAKGATAALEAYARTAGIHAAQNDPETTRSRLLERAYALIQTKEPKALPAQGESSEKE